MNIQTVEDYIIYLCFGIYYKYTVYCISIKGIGHDAEKFGYKRKEIKAAFEEAGKRNTKISTSYEKNSDLYILVKGLSIVTPNEENTN
jgi:hypothetical protein